LESSREKEKKWTLPKSKIQGKERAIGLFSPGGEVLRGSSTGRSIGLDPDKGRRGNGQVSWKKKTRPKEKEKSGGQGLVLRNAWG